MPWSTPYEVRFSHNTCITSALFRLDYGNAVLIGLPAYLVVVFSQYWMTRHASSTIWDPQTTSPTRLPVFTGYASQSGLSTKSPFWVTYKVLHGSAPRYLDPLGFVADLSGRRTLRSANTNRLLVPPVKLSTTSPLSRLIDLVSGTLCRRT